MRYDPPMFDVEYYVNEGGLVHFESWLDGLADKRAVARVLTRVERLARGALGDCRALHDGVWELKIDYGPGYRLYYAFAGATLIVLLCGGDKRKQQSDIERAVAYWQDYRRRTR